MQTIGVRHAMTLAITVPLAGIFLLGGCEKKLEEKDCNLIKAQAFDVLNKAQTCATDKDCLQSAWPGCEKPANQATLDEIKSFQTKFAEGKCEDKKSDCRKPPESYCKQGLCVHREVGLPEVPDDAIKIE